MNVALSEAHSENIVSSSEGLQYILVVNELVLEGLVGGFHGDLLSSPGVLESLVVPVEELILSLGNLLWDSLRGLAVGLGLHDQADGSDAQSKWPGEEHEEHGEEANGSAAPQPHGQHHGQAEGQVRLLQTKEQDRVQTSSVANTQSINARTLSLEVRIYHSND